MTDTSIQSMERRQPRSNSIAKPRRADLRPALWQAAITTLSFFITATPGAATSDYERLTGVTSSDGEVVLTDEATLADYLRHAALNNAGLRAAYNDWIAAESAVEQAGALPDPRLSYAYYFESVETRVGAQRHRVGISQTFPWLGKRRLRGEVASARAEQERMHFETRKLDLFFRVAEAYSEYYYLARSIESTRESIELLTYWEKLTQAKYRVGTGGHSDIIRVQIELGKLTDQLRTLEQLRGPMMARLNATLNRPAHLELPWPTALEPVYEAIDAAALIAEIDRTNPQLRALDAAVAHEDRAIALAEKSYFPDITLGFEWIETRSRPVADLDDNGQDALIGGLSFNLPVWWETYGAGVREAEARRRAATHRRSDRKNQLSSRLSLALYRYSDTQRKVDLYGKGLVPKAQESLAATFAAYEADESDFLDLLDAQQVLLDFRLSHHRALADQVRYFAECEMLAGRSLREPPPAEREGGTP